MNLIRALILLLLFLLLSLLPLKLAFQNLCFDSDSIQKTNIPPLGSFCSAHKKKNQQKEKEARKKTFQIYLLFVFTRVDFACTRGPSIRKSNENTRKTVTSTTKKKRKLNEFTFKTIKIFAACSFVFTRISVSRFYFKHNKTEKKNFYSTTNKPKKKHN